VNKGGIVTRNSSSYLNTEKQIKKIGIKFERFARAENKFYFCTRKGVSSEI
jgi:hypothetical protein